MNKSRLRQLRSMVAALPAEHIFDFTKGKYSLEVLASQDYVLSRQGFRYRDKAVWFGGVSGYAAIRNFFDFESQQQLDYLFTYKSYPFTKVHPRVVIDHIDHLIDGKAT